MISSLKHFYSPTKGKIIGLIIFYAAMFLDSMIRTVYYQILLSSYIARQSSFQETKSLPAVNPQDVFAALFLQNFFISIISLIIFYTAVCLILHLIKSKKNS